MSQMTTSQARIIDPLVTELALGYKSPAFVGNVLFPRVQVGQRGGRIPKFDREGLRRIDTKHAPGANVPRVSLKWSDQQFALVDRILHGQVPKELQEEGEAVPGINLRAESLQRVQDLIAMDVEGVTADLARNAALYPASNKVTLAGSARWTQTGSTPSADIREAKEAIRMAIGVEPNTLLLSQPAFNGLAENAAILDRFKYTSSESITADMLARYFQLDRVAVGSSYYLNDADVPTDLWGKDAILAYVPKGAKFREPTYGMSISLRGYPYAGQTYWEEQTQSWLVPWTDTVDPVLTMVTGGYLFVNAGDDS